jgi:uncharacterized protein YqjF (DUF2071 family)
MRTRFGHSLVLTYAVRPEALAALLPPGLSLDTYRAPDGVEHAFVAIGIVSVRGLRPAPLPAALGGNYLLTGYRIFTRFPTPGGRTMRGLYILRSDTDRRLMVLGGNLLTRYHYRLARMRLVASASRLSVTVHSRDGHADLAVTADLASRPAPLPPGSPFATAAAARRFAGPLPYTFDYESASHSMVVVKAHRTDWQPVPVAVEVSRLTFFTHGVFAGMSPVLANAFHVADLDYGWQRGSLRALDGTRR